MGGVGPGIAKQTEIAQNRGKYSVKRKINPIQLSASHLFPFPIKVSILCSSVPFYTREKISKCPVCP